jgi:hypothetical protein
MAKSLLALQKTARVALKRGTSLKNPQAIEYAWMHLLPEGCKRTGEEANV